MDNYIHNSDAVLASAAHIHNSDAYSLTLISIQYTHMSECV